MFYLDFYFILFDFLKKKGGLFGISIWKGIEVCKCRPTYFHEKRGLKSAEYQRSLMLPTFDANRVKSCYVLKSHINFDIAPQNEILYCK